MAEVIIKSEAAARKKIAVVGSGISGLTAAWLLQPIHEVTLYESEARLGGHSNTVDAIAGGSTTPVDTGFIVYNTHTYPNLIGFFKQLGVATQRSNMSFSVSKNNGALEYAGHNLKTIFADWRNFIRPSFWRMLVDIVRFYKTAPQVLTQPANPTLGEYLRAHNYSAAFIHDHLLPMAAAIWSSNFADILQFPLKSFVRFYVNHGLFKFKNRPEWRTVTGGSREYIKRILATRSFNVQSNNAVQSIRRTAGGVLLTPTHGAPAEYDEVILACHADEALALLKDATAAEQQVLGAFKFQPNTAYLHTDENLMPQRRSCWASWNYLAAAGESASKVALTYWMNLLQSLPPAQNFFVTLNPITLPAPAKTLQVIHYTHPQFSPTTLAAQQQLHSIQGQLHTWFCGAYTGYGFHEDGCASGSAVAEALGAARPWHITTEVSVAYENTRGKI